MSADPVRLEVFHQLLAAICEEAGTVLQRSAISPNIRERRDFSVAVFDARARLIGQAAHIPVHLGSAAEAVAAVRAALRLEPGDVAILNDPYQGGTHLPDITLVRPVFFAGDDEPHFFAVARAHHADVGGAAAGSMAVARDLLAEGLVIPPLALRKCGEHVRGVLDLLAANMRGAAERLVDLRAQEAALLVAERRLLALCNSWGREVVDDYVEHAIRYAAGIARGVVRSMPRGIHRAEDRMDDDGTGHGPFPIRLELEIRRDGLVFDWSNSAPQAPGGINANRGIVLAASVYAFACLCPERLPINDGVFQIVRVVTRAGTLLEPRSPAPVAGGNVETSQRLVDVALAALAVALPGRMPASSAGTMSNFTIGGPGFSQYETLPGGSGGGPDRAGASALQTHMTNTRNTPIEDTERRLPLRVTELTIRRGSGGAGRRRGGDGLCKEVELLAPATVSLFADRRLHRPPGIDGGKPGAPFRASVLEPGASRRRTLPAKTTIDLEAGARIRIETPGGGGHGSP